MPLLSRDRMILGARVGRSLMRRQHQARGVPMTMRAVLATGYGGPDALTVAGRDDPGLPPGHLLVRVAAAGVNYMDIYQREGRPPYRAPLPYVPGGEGAGT